jgi:hypothetical protein
MVLRREGPGPSSAMNLECPPFEDDLTQIDQPWVRCCERVRGAKGETTPLIWVFLSRFAIDRNAVRMAFLFWRPSLL